MMTHKSRQQDGLTGANVWHSFFVSLGANALHPISRALVTAHVAHKARRLGGMSLFCVIVSFAS